MRTFKYSEKEIKKAVDDYLAECKELNKTPFLVELGLKLGVTDDTLTNWQKTKQYSEHIKRVKKASELALLRKVSDDNKPVGGIFLLKANHGYQDTQKIDLTSNGKDLGVVQLPSIPD